MSAFLIRSACALTLALTAQPLLAQCSSCYSAQSYSFAPSPQFIAMPGPAYQAPVYQAPVYQQPLNPACPTGNCPLNSNCPTGNCPLNYSACAPRQVVQTEYVPRKELFYRDVTETRYRNENYTENVPVTRYEQVTVDEGSWKQVWVPKLVTKTVPRTDYVCQTRTRQVPETVTRRVPEVVTRWEARQVVRWEDPNQRLSYGDSYQQPTLAQREEFIPRTDVATRPDDYDRTERTQDDPYYQQKYDEDVEMFNQNVPNPENFRDPMPVFQKKTSSTTPAPAPSQVAEKPKTPSVASQWYARERLQK